MVRDRMLQVAPAMGGFDAGVAAFQRPAAPYARGGGTPASEKLGALCAQYFWGMVGVAPAAVVTASGQAANHLVFQALRGSHLVVSTALFGTTKLDLLKGFGRNGGSLSWVDPTRTEDFSTQTTPATRAWFVEATSNPASKVPDLEALHQAARTRGVLLVVDATLAVGMPGYQGGRHADILTVSLTKQAGGGGNRQAGGVVLVGDAFPWHERAREFPELVEYFTDASGKLALPPQPFAGLMTKIGTHEGSAVLPPQTAQAIGRSLPNLAARVAAMSANARAVADLLCADARLESVQLAGYRSGDPANDARAQQYLGGNGFVILITLRGGAATARQFVDSGVFPNAVALGQSHTAVAHPASSTHRHYTDAERAALGIYPGTLRLSIGTEPQRTLLRRCEKALASVA